MNLQSYGSFDDRLKTIIAFAYMTYIIDLDAYELHLRNEKVFNDFINEC